MPGVSVPNTAPSVHRGDIFYAELEPSVGSVQSGVRPVLIVQNDTGNRFSQTVIAVAITSQFEKKKSLPTHLPVLPGKSNGLNRPSVIIAEQILTLDKNQLKRKIGALSAEYMLGVDAAIRVSLGLTNRSPARRKLYDYQQDNF